MDRVVHVATQREVGRQLHTQHLMLGLGLGVGLGLGLVERLPHPSAQRGDAHVVVDVGRARGAAWLGLGLGLGTGLGLGLGLGLGIGLELAQHHRLVPEVRTLVAIGLDAADKVRVRGRDEAQEVVQVRRERQHNATELGAAAPRAMWRGGGARSEERGAGYG